MKEIGSVERVSITVLVDNKANLLVKSPDMVENFFTPGLPDPAAVE